MSHPAFLGILGTARHGRQLAPPETPTIFLAKDNGLCSNRHRYEHKPNVRHAEHRHILDNVLGLAHRLDISMEVMLVCVSLILVW
jgi:hypothetical protein